MKKIKRTVRLELSVETIRNLGDDKLTEVAGGARPTQLCTIWCTNGGTAAFSCCVA